MKVFNQTKNTVIADDAKLADSFFSRMKGLLGRRELKPKEGLVITRCNSIHMFFMKFPIDVIFIDREGLVAGLVPHIKPFALSPVYWKASRAIEVPVGTIAQSQTQVGDKIHLEE